MSLRGAQIAAGLLGLALLSCSGAGSEPGAAEGAQHSEEGPHGGRLLRTDDFALELAIIEGGRPPELHAWVTKAGRPVPAAEVALEVQLSRLGGRVDRIPFSPQGEFLRGEGVVEEPHSFEVQVEAAYAGARHSWRYPSFEGRTRIEPEMARALGIATATAGPVLMKESVTAYGHIRPDPGRVRKVRARFDGLIRGVDVGVGSEVQAGDRLLTVESDESLRSYAIFAPIGGVVTQRDANPGEQTDGRLLVTITDTSSVWAELSIFPGDRTRVRVGSPASVAPATGGELVSGTISILDVLASDNQAVVARVILDDPGARLLPGTFVQAEITVGEHEVPLAVMSTGLQTFRDFDVVYARVGAEYEVRMLELGREAGGHVEVLGGLEPGTSYVSGNSHLIKADIEKSGAAHDH